MTTTLPPPARPSFPVLEHASASAVNSIRLKAVAERLAALLRAGPSSHNMVPELFSHCLSLARGVDYSVVHNEIPAIAKDLPFLLKQICQRKGDINLQAGVMVLMFSVKNACKLGWFSELETQELLALVNEVGSCFGSPQSIGDGKNGLQDSNSVISAVMSRFYPLMKMGNILASLEAKPGYGAFVTDFHISKKIAHGPKEKIWLFVVQTDNIDTPACIITPQQVNFLLNGKGVEKRTNIFMDTGPQMPTNVTNMLKYGTNLLQVVGQFNGNYLIVIVFMSSASSPGAPVLLDFEDTAVVAPRSDSDIIEGPSRILLNCPISRTRIKIPVKGHSCKHLQCFDFNNYVDINSRRPSWRCPHCNQHVCYNDIRIDQNMVKASHRSVIYIYYIFILFRESWITSGQLVRIRGLIQVLKEVAPNVSAVIMTADGSWKAVPGSDDHTDQACKDLESPKDGSEHRDPSSSSDATHAFLDLTEDNSEASAMDTDEIEDRKPLVHQSSAMNLAVTSQQNDPVGIASDDSQTEDEFWSGLYLNYGPTVPNARIGGNINGSSSSAVTPMLTDAISVSQNGADASASSSLATNVLQNQFTAPSDVQLNQSQLVNSMSSPEYGSMQFVHRNINRTPVAVQALPVQSQTPTMLQRPRSNSNFLAPNGSSIPYPVTQSVSSATNGLNTPSTDIDRMSQLSRSHVSQSRSQQESSFTPGLPYQQVAGNPTVGGTPTVSRVSSGLTSELHNLLQQPTLNLRLPQSRIQSPGLTRSSSPLARTQAPQAVAQVGVSTAPQMSRYSMAAQRATQLGRQSSMLLSQTQALRTGSPYPVNVDNNIRAPVGTQRMNMGGLTQAVSTADATAELPSEQNWRPTGRMRGSLTGRQYSEALSQLMIQPSQPTQAARPPQTNQSAPSGLPPQLQAHLSNSTNPAVPRTETS